MFATLEDLAAQPDQHRTGQPVRRYSKPFGREGLFWRSTSRKEIDRIILAAERLELSGKLPGRKNGPLGGVALEVLRLFRHVVNFRTGRLDPSIDYLMGKLRRSRAAIVAGLKALRAHGFLDWLRRYVPTGNKGRGPQVQQTSNAYRLSLPKRAAAMLGRYFSPAPVPDDYSNRQEQQAAEIQAHRAGLSELERTMLDVDADDPLGAALLRMAQGRAERNNVSSLSRLNP